MGNTNATLLEIAKEISFWFSNETNYPEGTNGNRIYKKAKAAIEESEKEKAVISGDEDFFNAMEEIIEEADQWKALNFSNACATADDDPDRAEMFEISANISRKVAKAKAELKRFTDRQATPDALKEQNKKLLASLTDMRREIMNVLSRGKNYTPSWDEHDRLRKSVDAAEEIIKDKK